MALKQGALPRRATVEPANRVEAGVVSLTIPGPPRTKKTSNTIWKVGNRKVVKPSQPPTERGKIDINTADIPALESVPEIGTNFANAV